MNKYINPTQTSVTNFVVCNDKWLFVKRSPNKRVDPNRLNGTGGRLEPGENYIQAAIRETKEETGYSVTEKDLELAGVVKLHGGYTEDWIICFFRINVDSITEFKNIEEDDGELLWLTKEEIFSDKYELVDDLNYCFEDIINKKMFFLSATLNENEKIESISKSYLNTL